jgi:transcriptional regulator with XRE-family HTH domain
MPTLREIRKYRRMSQKEVAEKAGIDRVTYGRQERGTQKPLHPSLQRIADALEVDVADFDFPQWPEDFPNNLQLPSELKASNEDRAETQEQRLPNEEESPPEPKIVDIIVPSDFEDRVLSQAPSSAKEDSEEPPANKIEPKVEIERTTPSRNTRAEAKKLIKAEGNVGEVELEKDGTAGAALPFLYLFSRMSDKVALALMVVVLLVIVAFVIYLVRKSPAPKEEVKTSSGNPVTDYIANKYSK